MIVFCATSWVTHSFSTWHLTLFLVVSSDEFSDFCLSLLTPTSTSVTVESAAAVAVDQFLFLLLMPQLPSALFFFFFFFFFLIPPLLLVELRPQTTSDIHRNNSNIAILDISDLPSSKARPDNHHRRYVPTASSRLLLFSAGLLLCFSASLLDCLYENAKTEI